MHPLHTAGAWQGLPSQSSKWIFFRLRLPRYAVPRVTPAVHGRSFLSTTAHSRSRNVLYDPVKSEDQFHTYLLHSSSSRQPLITLWTASWCSACKTVAPVVREAVEMGAGEEHGGVSFCEVWAFDSTDARNLGMTYMLTSVPTLLAFDDAQNPRYATRLVDPKQIGNPLFVKQWLEREARDGGSSGNGGNGSGTGSGLGGLFGGWKK